MKTKNLFKKLLRNISKTLNYRKVNFTLQKFVRLISIYALVCIGFTACKKNFVEHEIQANSKTYDKSVSGSKPNVILFIADDFGYELPTYTGGQSYSTPNMDFMAAQGMQFSKCYCHPDGYPSRLAVFTGKYNFRNYTKWGQLPVTEKTIANMLHDAGYATCYVGKWQCDGGDARIRSAGFDNYRVFMPFAKSGESYRFSYKNPHLYEAGAYLPDNMTSGKYSEDMYVDYVNNFIDNNTATPFFVVYANNLPHHPWSPTPDDPAFASWDPATATVKGDKQYFPEMIAYLDKVIGELIKKIEDKGLQNNTLIMFISDNATNRQITSIYKGKQVRGGKNYTSDRGTHDPFVAYWPSVIAPGQNSTALVDYTDFLPSLADVAGISKPSNYGILDGVSFYDNMLGTSGTDRNWVFCHWDNNLKDAKPPIRYVNDLNYKLYDTLGYKNFYNIITDINETSPLPDGALTQSEKDKKNQFEAILQQMHN